ncbi:MAG: basic amino acid ABC transporter substrate-binding protein [Clostridia bacterium]|nr:basic amino acid ABC transporter substrate-binding protein [Clostridia bacterium]
MKKALKIAVIVVAIAAMVVAFAACGGKKAETTAIKFGTNAEFPPFEYINNQGGIIDKFDGIDMAIAKAIGEKTGKEAKIENMEFDSLLIALQNGQIDATISGMTITEERKQAVDFSHPYYEATQVMIVKDGSDIKTAKDMADKKIVVIQGYTGEECVKDLGYKYEAFKKGSEAILELKNGKCDVVVLDSATALNYIGDNKDLKVIEDKEAFEVEEYGIAVKKGNTELLNQINEVIDAMKADGTLGKLAVQFQ